MSLRSSETCKTYQLDGVVIQKKDKQNSETIFGSWARTIIGGSNEKGEFKDVALSAAADYPEGRSLSGRVQHVILRRTDAPSPNYSLDSTYTMTYDEWYPLSVPLSGFDRDLQIVQTTAYEHVHPKGTDLLDAYTQ